MFYGQQKNIENPIEKRLTDVALNDQSTLSPSPMYSIGVARRLALFQETCDQSNPLKTGGLNTPHYPENIAIGHSGISAHENSHAGVGVGDSLKAWDQLL